ncbi:tRNA glutamyl-Q(34) synthetase GluQRS [bacterium]|nr:tRNA glutamyl-Q(34) synthetase GluQRS [bacterium]
MIVGRYAPSPTGSLHLGNLRTALAAWASTRSRDGRFLLRIEDLDGDRCRPELIDRQLADLRNLGVDWDAEPIIQSQRTDVYTAEFEKLKRFRLVYPCFCSRRDIAEAASAPHGPGPGVYPGTCANLPATEVAERIAAGRQHCWRIRVEAAPTTFFDALIGPREIDLKREGGDFVVRRADGWFAYQFACAVDDALSGVTEVVRGADLLDSGARQAWVLDRLGLPVPRYLHLPLMLGENGARLSKRVGSEDMDGLTARGFSPDSVRSYLAWTLGLCGTGERITMSEVASRWDWKRVPQGDFHHQDAILETFR